VVVEKDGRRWYLPTSSQDLADISKKESGSIVKLLFGNTSTGKEPNNI
jgi:hypothetical protein